MGHYAMKHHIIHD